MRDTYYACEVPEADPVGWENEHGIGLFFHVNQPCRGCLIAAEVAVRRHVDHWAYDRIVVIRDKCRALLQEVSV